jgi:hypothetical protein
MNWARKLQRPLRIEITRDAVIPFSANDPDMLDGWRCIPIPPTADPGWFIIDDKP